MELFLLLEGRRGTSLGSPGAVRSADSDSAAPLGLSRPTRPCDDKSELQNDRGVRFIEMPTDLQTPCDRGGGSPRPRASRRAGRGHVPRPLIIPRPSVPRDSNVEVRAGVRRLRCVRRALRLHVRGRRCNSAWDAPKSRPRRVFGARAGYLSRSVACLMVKRRRYLSRAFVKAVRALLSTVRPRGECLMGSSLSALLISPRPFPQP
ncbi:hypothetical protein SKAU_G00105110 [Synaphobranchus kaupii]|uniref:Uncharacterized protein n=1 Tax=Synaphobranchus kaupii TaxID=118154 RepID=A0A9Q1G042_SYNKA|nr:hypothetical protein SKAU_G00105110 [Synaphobranchus kaupii]